MTLNELPSGFQEQPSPELAQTFDYAALEPKTRIVVEQCTTEIKSLMRRTASDTIEIGQKLTQVKQKLGHGHFVNWLKTEFNWSVSAATKFMQVNEQFKYVNFTHLNIAASALYLLAAPSTPQAARHEALERAHSGETITSSVAEVIVSKYKELSNVSMASEPLTIDIPAESVEKADPVPAEEEPVEYIEQNQPSIDENTSVSEVVQDYPDDADQSEQELLGKKLQRESSLSEMSKSNLTSHNEPTRIENKGKKKMEQNGNEICKNLRSTLTYINQEDIFEEIALEDLKSLEEEITLLVKRKEASLNKHYNSNYSSN